VRKRAPSTRSAAFFAETALLAPAAVGFLGLRAASGAGAFGSAPGTSALLAAAGVITALPLVWFTLAVHRLRLRRWGSQYIAPTGQFLLGVALYREPFTRGHAAAFGLIWASLALYTWDTLARVRVIER
jgi:chloramphenicol-sensitive protein RarD